MLRPTSALFVTVTYLHASHTLLSTDLNKQLQMSRQCGMQFNPDNSRQAVAVAFSALTPILSRPQRFHCIPLSKVDSIKHFGINLDKRSTSNSHIRRAITKARKGVAFLRFPFKFADKRVYMLPRNSTRDLPRITAISFTTAYICTKHTTWNVCNTKQAWPSEIAGAALIAKNCTRSWAGNASKALMIQALVILLQD